MRLLRLFVLFAMLSAAAAADEPTMDVATVENFANLALHCIHQEYPNKIGHVMSSDDDVAPPRELTPAFYGCFDWHSSVHGHWLLTRLSKLYPDAQFTAAARKGLGQSLRQDRVAGDAAYLAGEGRASYERPYGLAWLLQLAAELRTWDDQEAQLWAFNLGPLERQAAKRISEWLPKWKANGWRRREGKRLKEIKNEDLWRRLDELLHKYELRPRRWFLQTFERSQTQDNGYFRLSSGNRDSGARIRLPQR